MAFNTKDDGDDIMGEINVTPLVDVMLVLLVVFIVTAPLLTNAVHVNLPKTEETAPPEEKEAVYLSVDAQGKIFIDKKEIKKIELIEKNNPEWKDLYYELTK